jgi:xanthine dehydrogenase small subunit
MKTRNYILFYLNGERHQIAGEQAGLMLSDYLRYHKNLTGTKIVCAEGDCGACSVLRFFPYHSGKKKNIFLAINSCISTVAQMDGSHLVTVDALAKPDHTPVQKAMMNCHGSQCGFCTPGFVMALTGLVEKKLCQKQTEITSADAKNATTGNLCRCTGYQPIIDAAKNISVSDSESVAKRFYSVASQKDISQHLEIPIRIESDHFSFYAPTKIKEAIAFLSKNKSVRIVGASTDLGVVHNKRKLRLTDALSLHLISELYEIEKEGKTRLSVGARVTLSDLRLFVKDLIPEFATFLDLFASPQIKNLATLVGNVANASPIADTPPFLLTMNTEVEIHGPKGQRFVKLESFFLDYRKIAMTSKELIVALHFDIPQKNESLALYKISQRKDLDISAINFAARVSWADKEKTKIKDIKIAVGGVAATTLRLYKTEKSLTNETLDQARLSLALEHLHTEITPLSDLRATSAFRHVVAENLFYKFFREQGVKYE